MANTSVINGLVYRKGPRRTNEYYIPSSDNTAVFVGDLVKLGGSADHATGVATVIQAAAGSSTCIHVGVVTAVNQVKGVSVSDYNPNRVHRPASVGMYVSVDDHPLSEYEIQMDNDSEVGMPDMVGCKADILVAAGSATTGKSGMSLDTSSATTTGTLPLLITGLIDRADTEIGTTSTGVNNAKALVMIATHWQANSVSTAQAQ